MDLADFERIIRQTVAKIPSKFRRILKKEGIALIAQESPPSILSKRLKKGAIVFGVFLGVSYDKRSVFNIGGEPTRIELYKESFERAFKGRREIEEQIVRTVVHEIGHYFGFSERSLRRYGL